MLSWKVADNGSIECTKTKEIILDKTIQLFARELNGELFKVKINWKLTKIIEK